MRELNLLLWVLLFYVGPAQADFSTLSCLQNNQQKCKDISTKLAPLDKEALRKLPPEPRKAKFIAWLKPFALHLQAISGFPASVLLAQAGVHSEWGDALAFRLGNNIFGHVCWEEKSVLEGKFETPDQTAKFKATCTVLKGDPKNRSYYSFATPDDSVLSHMAMLLNSRNRQVKNIQNEVKQSYQKTHPGVAHFRVVIGLLGGYSSKENYKSTLAGILENERLQDLDAGPCQSCIFQNRRLKNLLEKTSDSKDTKPAAAKTTPPKDAK